MGYYYMHLAYFIAQELGLPLDFPKGIAITLFPSQLLLCC